MCFKDYRLTCCKHECKLHDDELISELGFYKTDRLQIERRDSNLTRIRSTQGGVGGGSQFSLEERWWIFARVAIHFDEIITGLTDVN